MPDLFVYPFPRYSWGNVKAEWDVEFMKPELLDFFFSRNIAYFRIVKSLEFYFARPSPFFSSSLCGAGWPQTQGDPHAFASQVLRLEDCH